MFSIDTNTARELEKMTAYKFNVNHARKVKGVWVEHESIPLTVYGIRKDKLIVKTSDDRFYPLIREDAVRIRCNGYSFDVHETEKGLHVVPTLDFDKFGDYVPAKDKKEEDTTAREVKKTCSDVSAKYIANILKKSNITHVITLVDKVLEANNLYELTRKGKKEKKTA